MQFPEFALKLRETAVERRYAFLSSLIMRERQIRWIFTSMIIGICLISSTGCSAISSQRQSMLLTTKRLDCATSKLSTSDAIESQNSVEPKQDIHCKKISLVDELESTNPANSVTTSTRPSNSSFSMLYAERLPPEYPQPIIQLASNSDKKSVERTSIDDATESQDDEDSTEKTRLSFWNDVKTSRTWLVDDLQSLATIENAVFISMAAGGALLIRSQVDGQIDQSVNDHGDELGPMSHFLNACGQSIVHAPLLGGLYGYSLYTQDEELHELALTFAASYKFTAISTLVLQYSTETRHGHYGGLSMLMDNGFPSMPASTSFALAAVVDEKFGWKAGIPAYAAAGLIGWAGIDLQEHRLSDVVFGAALGYAIGKSI